MIKNSSDVEAYFEKLAELHPQINYFMRGPFDRYIAESDGKLKWPVLWMEDPSIQQREEEGTTYFFHIQIMKRTVEDDWEMQNEAMTLMEQIMANVLRKLYHDADQGIFSLNRGIKMEPITGITHSHDVGYQIQLQLNDHQSFCPPDPDPGLPEDTDIISLI